MITRLTRARRWLSLLAAASLAAAVIAGYPTHVASQSQPQPTFRTEANYVRVDVYATTRDGRPIEDLRRDEFEVLEDKVPQTVDQFATVRIQGGGRPTGRPDPRTPEENRQAATDARARVFILFLDAMHVDRTASIKIASPVTDALRNLLGADDLLAVVSPGMSLRALTFTRQMATIENALSRPWGGRDQVNFQDPVEQRYAECYPGIPRQPGTIATDRGIAQEMILRRREAHTLDALEELITYLRDAREERKAVLIITNGWRLYRPNDNLRRSVRDEVPSAPQVAVDPRSGRLTTEPTGTASRANACDNDRLSLASLDHETRFRRILDQANRANVSFYPVDPRGIVAFDDDILPVAGVGQNPVLSPDQERSRLEERSGSLHTMAERTDGVAVVATNDFALGLRRMITDLSAYYLLGYYSTGKLDGNFHAITVRVTRPGVEVRARRGYLAATTVSAPAPLGSAGSAAGVAEAQAIAAAFESLGPSGREATLRIQAALGPASANLRSISAVVEAARTGITDWSKGGEADVFLVDKAGATLASSHVTFTPGALSARTTIGPRTLAPGVYELRVRGKAAGSISAATESLSVTVPDHADGTGFVLFRRGPVTGNREIPTADLRFRRSDTLRVAVPASSSPDISARLLDRTGRTLAVPVMASTVDEADGSKWHTAQLVLAPLAQGDYVIEIATRVDGSERRMLTAFRIVP